jgi:hypothetical protein
MSGQAGLPLLAMWSSEDTAPATRRRVASYKAPEDGRVFHDVYQKGSVLQSNIVHRAT